MAGGDWPGPPVRRVDTCAARRRQPSADWWPGAGWPSHQIAECGGRPTPLADVGNDREVRSHPPPTSTAEGLPRAITLVDLVKTLSTRGQRQGIATKAASKDLQDVFGDLSLATIHFSSGFLRDCPRVGYDLPA